jgi:hypothetical protein
MLNLKVLFLMKTYKVGTKASFMTQIFGLAGVRHYAVVLGIVRYRSSLS